MALALLPAPGLSAAQPAPEPPAKLKLLTCNVLADEDDADERAPALFKLLEDHDADLLALQEVAPWMLKRLESLEWVRRRYRSTTIDATAPGGLFLVSKWPILRAELKPVFSKQGRGVLMAELNLGAERLAVASVHLESFLDSGLVRVEQLKDAFKLLDGAAHAVLLGDFNFGDGEQPESAALPAAFADCWRALKPADPGFTWNMETNPMARLGAFPNEKSRRLDRVLLRSPAWKPAAASLVGDAPLDGKPRLFPSDHFGLAVELERAAPPQPEPRRPAP
ncbi:MAG: endonuclease/exonuclease/phosphatase family protein [Planctomycetota bacterium]|nr:endonuclease/exonuclease/phosphatase family protein [Planctomycetota bacterium]